MKHVLEAVFNFDNTEFSRQFFANQGGHDAAYVERTQGGTGKKAGRPKGGFPRSGKC